jgi:hypothetical protein
MCAAPRLNAQIFGHIRPMPDSSGVFADVSPGTNPSLAVGRESNCRLLPGMQQAPSAVSCLDPMAQGHSAPSPDWQWPRARARDVPRYYRSRPSLFRHAR